MNLIVGGQHRDGSDATNDLSFMCLQAAANTKLYAPSLSIRIHEGTPASLYKKAAELSRLGMPLSNSLVPRTRGWITKVATRSAPV